MRNLILASASPRRRELLDQIGVQYLIRPVDLDEAPLNAEQPIAYVKRIAAEKSALALSLEGPEYSILAADTTVVLNNEIIGKPMNKGHAIQLLKKLSGKTHQVLSAVSLRSSDNHWQSLSMSNVTFRTISEQEINAYWNTGEPADKAGAYGIQGYGSIFVERIEGSFSGVMGLPLFETAQLLENIGISIIHD